jgi:transcriptional regulator with XRE-family HTH domain
VHEEVETMTIGDRIRQARTEKGLTLEYVGDRVGVTRATIQKYENGLIASIPSDKVSLIARVLNVSPAYIMGWETKEETPGQLQLTEGEKAILALFRQVPVEHQNMVVEMIRVALKQKE